MKRLTALLCILLFVLAAVTACGGTGAGTETLPDTLPETVPETAAPTEAPETQPADVPTEPATEAPTETPTETPTEPETEPETAPAAEVFEPVLRFIACSDLHIPNASSTEATRFRKMMQRSYKYAAEQPGHTTVDALVIAGDLTNEGRPEELQAVRSLFKSAVHDETTVIAVMGNHEFNVGGYASWQANMSDELDVHVVVNGFHFIGMSPETDSMSFGTAKQKWLKEQLAEAVEDDPYKPIFTFQHQHIQNTVYVSRSWYTPTSGQLNRIFKDYPQTVNFSGHSHGPVNNPISFWQDGYTLVGTGTLSYFEMEKGMTEPTVPENAGNAAQFWIVEVDAENRVRFLPYNLLTDDFFRTPSNTDDPEAQLIYTIDNPCDPASFLYTPDRKKNAAAPRFAEDAALTVTGVTENSVTVTFPQALDDQCIYGYRCVFSTEGEKDKESSWYSRYYFEPLPETLTFTVGGLKEAGDYTVRLYPVNVWDKEGEPLEASFHTGGSAVTEYVSVNPVTYYGTFTDFDSMTTLTRSQNTFVYGGSIGGDVFGGDWNNDNASNDVRTALAEGRGYNGSTGLAVAMTAASHVNRAVYVFATEENKNATKYPSASYLRVWVDFTGIDFRKACFGLVTSGGQLFSTDDFDNRNNQKFYYMADGTDTWRTFTHGNDGCFGAAQNSSVKDFKGWLAFPLVDMGDRTGSGQSFSGHTVVGVYMYWDLNDNAYLNTDFILDELQLVDDYTVFMPMNGN